MQPHGYADAHLVGPDRGGDEFGAHERADPEVVERGVFRFADQLEERPRRRVCHGHVGIPPRPLPRSDDERRCRARGPNARADPLQVRRSLPPVLQVTLKAVGLAEFQQVDQ